MGRVGGGLIASTLLEDEPQNRVSPCPQGEADAHLSRAAGHTIGHDPVEPHHGQQQSREPESRLPESLP
jgi:hypothetical protein